MEGISGQWNLMNKDRGEPTADGREAQLKRRAHAGQAWSTVGKGPERPTALLRAVHPLDCGGRIRLS